LGPATLLYVARWTTRACLLYLCVKQSCSTTPLPSRVRNFPPPTLTHRCRERAPLAAAADYLAFSVIYYDVCYHVTTGSATVHSITSPLSYATRRLSRHDELCIPSPIWPYNVMRAARSRGCLRPDFHQVFSSTSTYRILSFRVVGYEFLNLYERSDVFIPLLV